MNAPSLDSRPAYTAALLRHFVDLRDGTHGGARSRPDKERLFAAAVELLDPYARQALDEVNRYLLLGTGDVTATGVRRSAGGGIDAVWSLTWPAQQAAGIDEVAERPPVEDDEDVTWLLHDPLVHGRTTTITRLVPRMLPPAARLRRSHDARSPADRLRRAGRGREACSPACARCRSRCRHRLSSCERGAPARASRRW